MASQGGPTAPTTPHRLAGLSTLAGSGLLDAAAVAALFLVAHPYSGITGDARIYLGRGLADLDPTGVGRDLMFVHDGQSGFTAFSFVLRHLVGWLGVAQAGLLLSLLGLAAWFGAAGALAARLAEGRARWAILAAMAVLPTSYGFPGVFRVAEALAVPRPFAEAAVLAGLAALLADRKGLAFGFVVLACLFHPIMGLAGIAVLMLVLVREDPRWLVVAALGGLAAAGAAAAGLPVFDRLLAEIDPEWRAILDDRSPYLFPSAWPVTAWGAIIVPAGTIAMAAPLAPGRARHVLLAGLGAGLGGLALAATFGDRWPSLLLVQLQPWRLLWLMAVLGAAAFGLCVTRLIRQGYGGWIVLACLATGWVRLDEPAMAGGAVALALAIREMESRGVLTPSRFLFRAVACVAAALIVLKAGLELWAVAGFLAHQPAGGDLPWAMLRNGAAFLPLTALGAFLWFRRPLARGGRVLAVLVFALTALALFDQRTSANLRMEDGTALPGLARRVASRPGEVLWLRGGYEPWLMLGRPSWITALQGASMVFSRPLALVWSEHTDRLVALGLSPETERRPFATPARPDFLAVEAPSLAALCASRDAPAWIVVPVTDTEPVALPEGAETFALPVPQVVPEADAEHGLVWRTIRAYALLACRA